MAIFEGTIQEYHHHVGPKIRNSINILSSGPRKARNGVWEHCNQHSEQALHSAHVPEKGRRKIIEKVLKGYMVTDVLVRCNLDSIEQEILSEHHPIAETFKFLCPACHVKYDNPAIEPPKVSPTFIGAVAPIIVLFPADERSFKSLFIKNKKAFVALYNEDGTVQPVRIWKHRSLKDSSNLKWNIDTGPLRDWKKKGIARAVLAIDELDLSNYIARTLVGSAEEASGELLHLATKYDQG